MALLRTSRPAACTSPAALSRRTRALSIVLATSAVVALRPVATSAQTADDSVAVRARIDAYRTAWDAHDASTVAAFFADDADFVMGNRPAAAGRRAIRDWWSVYFSRQEPQRHLALDVYSMRFVTADVAVIDVVTTTGGRDREGRDLLARRFRGTWVVHRHGGEWLIAAMRGLPTEEDRVVLNASLEATDAFRPRIRAFIDAYEDAFNRHDPSAVSAFYGDDADLIVRNGPVIHGRPAIEDWWASYFSEPRPYRALLIVKDIRMVTPDVALINVIGTGAVAAVTAEPTPLRYARATWLLARNDDGWRIVALRVLPSEDDGIVRGGER